MHRNKKVWFTHGEKKLIEIAPEEVQTLDLLDKDYKSIILICSRASTKN